MDQNGLAFVTVSTQAQLPVQNFHLVFLYMIMNQCEVCSKVREEAGSIVSAAVVNG